MLASRRETRRQALMQGEILSRLHWRCWREDPPPANVTDLEFVSVMPILIRSGSVGLVWPRLRHRFEPESAISQAMEAAFRAQRNHNRQVEREIGQLVTLLREHGIEPVLVKGWAIARLYPPNLVRPAGDIDLIVADDELARAESILAGTDGSRVGIDLQAEGSWPDQPVEGFRQRLVSMTADGVPVTTLGLEDHLRLQCLHLVRHGGRRALWLCDVAEMREQLGHTADEPVLFGAGETKRRWISTVLNLASRLVGANGMAQDALPPWLVVEVMRQWGETDPFPTEVLGEVRSNPRAIVQTFRRRWPPPIRAFWLLRLPLVNCPRLPVQVAAYLKLTVSYALFRLPKQASKARRIAPMD